ncbi:MAG: radical SAM protein [Deltaproteobacteria bacterium]|nr:radical SAM protein [Deltaproteobacteria bacterium]MBW1993516.1 radical SAM protein [Deltaproteobacteria bacterium]
MNILLISAGSSSFKGALWGAYDFDLPLNVAYVAAYLEANGLSVTVCDLQLPGVDINCLLEQKDIHRFSFIGISANLSSYRQAYQTALFLRNRHYAGFIFIFGPLGLYLQEMIFDECPGIDFVIYGEEEPTILDLIRNYAAPQGVKGICYLKDDQIKKSPSRRYLSDLDTLPFPARGKFNINRYFPSPGKYYVLPQITMLSSRGCNYHCLFCEKTGGSELRFRRAENIFLEIEEVVSRYGAREICFVDEIFGSNKEETLKLCELLIKKNFGIYLRISTRVDFIDREILTALKRAGLYSVGVGIESGSDQILKYNNKQITTSQVRQTIKLIKSLDLETRGYFMINMPGETKESIKQTKDFIDELKLDLVNVQIAYPYPNTAFRKLAERKYRIIEDKWNRWELSDGDDVVFTQSDLTEAYLKMEYRNIIRRNFLNPRFIARWLKRIKTFHDFKYSFLQFLNLLSM